MRLSVSHVYCLDTAQRVALEQALDLAEALQHAAALDKTDVAALKQARASMAADTMHLNLTVLMPLLRLLECAAGHFTVQAGPSSRSVQALQNLRAALRRSLET